MKYIFAMLLASMIGTAHAAQSCICTAPAGCTIASDPFPAGQEQPTSCTLKAANGSVIASAPTVDSTTLPLSNATSCVPASPPYVPIAGSVACKVFAGNTYAVGNTLQFQMTATYASTGESAPSAMYSFVNVAALPKLPGPLNLRLAAYARMYSEPYVNPFARAWIDG